ncbi:MULTISPECIES: YwqJ-related putative deaminase [unclassified Pseudomonas]|uniref:YwqJ-related putative deaminase n=1 Tax=unclassified Pseudomonas TaxID=196821 RepID=UPI00211440D1|nr:MULTISPECIES: YwqJ-related putative deaminase [unclassified Pseudomonas]
MGSKGSSSHVILLIHQSSKEKKEKGTDLFSLPLTPQVKGMIENLVSNGKRFDVQNGIPGLHAEVRAVNSALTRYPKVSIDDVKVATYKLAPKQGQGDKFEACSNCSGVLKDADVISGRKH